MKTVNFKGAVPTQDDVNMKRNRILLMLYVACNMLLGPFCCLCFACVSALDHEFQDSRGLCAVAQPHHLQSATDVLWIAGRSNQSILKEISPGRSLEGLLLKLKLQYFGYLM